MDAQAHDAPRAAEQAYLFRHAVLRDAAYQLHLLSERAALHGHALDILESMGVDFAKLINEGPGKSTDPAHNAEDLAHHARQARADPELPEDRAETLEQREFIYRWHAGAAAHRNYRPRDAARLLQEAAQLQPPLARQKSHVLHQLANAFREIGRFADARASARTALEIARRTGDVGGEIAALNVSASLLHSLGRDDEAEKDYLKALSLSESGGDANAHGMILGNLANLYADTGRMVEAGENYQKALALLRSADGNAVDLARALANYATFLINIGRVAEGKECLDAALDIAVKSGDLRRQAFCHSNLAIIYSQSGRLSLALKETTAALAMHRAQGNRAQEGQALIHLGSDLFRAGSYAQAEIQVREGIAILTELKSKRVVDGLVVLAEILRVSGRIAEAKAALDQVFPEIAQKDIYGRCRAQTQLAVLLFETGECEKAESQAREALQLAAQSEDRGAEGEIRLELALLLRETGREKEALSELQAAIALASAIGDKRLELRAARELSELYRITDRTDQAALAAASAMKMSESTGEPLEQARSLMQQCAIQMHAGVHEQARAGLERAIEMFRQAPCLPEEAKALGYLGAAHHHLGEIARAKACYRDALKAARAGKDRRAEGITLMNLGILYWETGKPVRGRGFLLRALKIHRATKNARFVGITLSNLAELAQDRGRRAKAHRLFTLAADILHRVGDARSERHALLGLAKSAAQRRAKSRR